MTILLTFSARGIDVIFDDVANLVTVAAFLNIGIGCDMAFLPTFPAPQLLGIRLWSGLLCRTGSTTPSSRLGRHVARLWFQALGILEILVSAPRGSDLVPVR